MKVETKRLVFKLLLIRRLRRRLKRKPRQSVIRPLFANRLTHGESFLVRELRSDPEYHFKYFRMSKANFDEILEKIGEDITHARTNSRPISALEKLALTIRYLASGNSQVSLALNYRISPSSVCHIIREVLEQICQKLGPECLKVPTEQDWKINEEGFQQLWNFPNAIGAMDGKHVRIQAPAFSGSTYYNYKNYFSIVLMAVVDPWYKFSLVDIGASGSQSDGGVLNRSAIGRKLHENKLGVPSPKHVGETLLPHVILADDAFALQINVMKPFPGKFLEKTRRIYNYRLSRGRMVVENAFGVLSARWRILLTTILGELGLTKKIVEACIILHNYLLMKKDYNNITTDTVGEGHFVPGNWRENSQMQPITRQGSNNYATSTAEIRIAFMDYFNSEEGSVSWQDGCI